MEQKPFESCAVTGHRPTRFAFRYDESDPRCAALKQQLRCQLIRLCRRGVRRFWVGGALGVDLWVTEALLALRAEGCYAPEICLAVPFEGYDAGWSEADRQRMAAVRLACQQVAVVTDGADPAEDFKVRNRYMVDRADCLLAVWDSDRRRSGTGMTVHYAERLGLPVLVIHPDTLKVHYLLPEQRGKADGILGLFE